MRFLYDAVDEVSLYIYFGGRDTGAGKEARYCALYTPSMVRIVNTVDSLFSPESGHLQWGPYILRPGLKQEWSSSSEQLYGDPRYLVCGMGGLYDAIVVLDQSAASVSPRGGKKRGKFLSYGGGTGVGDAESLSAGGGGGGGEDMAGTVRRGFKVREGGSAMHLREVLMCAQGGGRENSVVRHASYFVVKPTPQTFVRVRMQSSSSSREPAGDHDDHTNEVAVSKGSHRNRRKQSNGRPQVRVEGHSPESSSNSSSSAAIAIKARYTGPLAVTCEMQKIQMQDGGVFVVQSIYGMDRGGGGVRKEGNADEQDVDTDAAECVICLTEEKEVVVFPCRHMCMCMSCAEALPSQNNNCPICRRPVTLLLRCAQLLCVC